MHKICMHVKKFACTITIAMPLAECDYNSHMGILTIDRYNLFDCDKYYFIQRIKFRILKIIRTYTYAINVLAFLGLGIQFCKKLY